MISHRTEKIFLWILCIGLFSVLATFVIFVPEYFFPYITPRAAYFQILVAILFAITLIFVALAPQYRPRKTQTLVAIGLYLFANVISTLFSEDPSKSFTGSFERAFGLFQIFHFGMLFVIAAVVIRSLKLWKSLIAASTLVALFIGTGFFIGTFLWLQLPNSLTGNRSFLAGYLFIHLFFAAYLFFETKIAWKKSFLAIASFALLVFIFSTGVRGVILGFGAALVYFAIYIIVKFPVWRKKIIGFILLMLGIYGLLFINRNEEFLLKNYFAQQITTNMNLQDATVQARFAMWRSALKGALERPLLGWGRENYSLVFNKHFDKRFDLAKVGESWEDRAHNIFIDELVVGGVFGLAAFLFLIFCAFRAVRRNPLLTGLLVGYLGFNSFGVETANTAISFFLFLGLADFLTREHITEPLHGLRSVGLWKFLSVALAILMLPTSIYISVRMMQGNKELLNSFKAMSQNDFLAFESSYREGKQLLKPFSYLFKEALILSSSAIPQQAAFAVPYEKIIADDLAKIVDSSPWELRGHVSLGVLYTLIAIHTNDAAYLDRANEVFAKLLSLTPDRKIFQTLYEQNMRIREAITAGRAPAPQNP